jgi:hypothetical protein
MPRERANERACDAAIRRTLAYRSIFKYPLSYHQLANTLITNKIFRKDFYDKELAKMVKKGYIGYRNGKYFDKRIKPVSWDLRYKQSQQYVADAKKLASLLSRIPWVMFIGVTGSTAAYNAEKEDDIDFFIIAKTHRLWLTRGFVTLILKIVNKYAQYGKGPGKVCPNLYIDMEVFEWPEDQRSIFTAHEIMLMHPLVNKENTYFKFLKANDWIRQYFAHFPISEVSTKKQNEGSRLINLFEKIAQQFQLKYMQNKRTNEVITPHMLHFKKNDNTNWITDKFKELSNV